MIDINLIATRRAQRQRALALMRLAFYSLFGLAIAIVLMYAWMTVQTRLVVGQIANADAVLNAPEMQEKMARVAFLHEEIRVLTPRAKILQRVHDSEERWIEVMRDVGSNVPANVWVTGCTSRPTDKQGQKIDLSGAAYSQRLIGAYMLALQRQEWCGPMELIRADASRDSSHRGEVDFELSIPLVEPIGVNLIIEKKPKPPAGQPVEQQKEGVS